MPTKRKRSPTTKAASATKARSATTPGFATEPIELVVRRGALWRFNTLKKKTADLPVKVMWDRRQTDRRAASENIKGERRASDRRQKPPFTWEVADFVVVGQTDGTEAKPAATRKKKTPRAKIK
jgi:hypothetical protein